MSEPNKFVEGQYYERGAWIPTELHAPGAARQIVNHFFSLQKKHRIKFSKIDVEVLKGNHERAPKPQLQPFFVVVWAVVEKETFVETIDVSWVHGLKPWDLFRLREATKRALHPKEITTSEADLVIGILGPKLARKQLEQKLHLVDGKFLQAANDVRIGD